MNKWLSVYSTFQTCILLLIDTWTCKDRVVYNHKAQLASPWHRQLAVECTLQFPSTTSEDESGMLSVSTLLLAPWAGGPGGILLLDAAIKPIQISYMCISFTSG